MFSFAELTKVMRQRGDKHFIDLLNKVCVRNVDSEVEKRLKSRIICNSDLHYPKYAVHVFAENVLVLIHNKVMLDQINGMPVTIDVTNSIHIGCRFSDSQIMAARNRSISQTNLYLTGTFKKDTKKANTETLHEFDRLQKEAIFTLVSLLMSLPETL